MKLKNIDPDRNGKINLSDVSEIFSKWTASDTTYDISGTSGVPDSKITIDDIVEYARHFGRVHSLPKISDISGTPTLNLNQLTQLKISVLVGDTSSLIFEWDFDGDGKFDVFDTGNPDTTVAFSMILQNVYVRVTDTEGYTFTLPIPIRISSTIQVDPVTSDTQSYSDSNVTIEFPPATFSGNDSITVLFSASDSYPLRSDSIVSFSGTYRLLLQTSSINDTIIVKIPYDTQILPEYFLPVISDTNGSNWTVPVFEADTITGRFRISIPPEYFSSRTPPASAPYFSAPSSQIAVDISLDVPLDNLIVPPEFRNTEGIAYNDEGTINEFYKDFVRESQCARKSTQSYCRLNYGYSSNIYDADDIWILDTTSYAADWSADDKNDIPVALVVHGIFSYPDNFTNGSTELIDWLKSKGYAVWTYQYPWQTHIDQNGNRLKKAISDKITALGLDSDPNFKIDIFAHSMGALVSRWAIEKEGMDSRVRKLFTFGGMHNGTEIADPKNAGKLITKYLVSPFDLLYSIQGSAALIAGMYSDGMKDMRPNSTILDDLKIGDKVNVDYYTIAGGDPGTLGIAKDIIFDGSDNDGWVPVSSANWSGLSNEANFIAQYTESTANHSEIHNNANPAVGIFDWLENYITTFVHDTWVTKSTIPTSRMFLASGVIDGKIFVTGGTWGGDMEIQANEQYDPSTDGWVAKTSIPTGRSYMSGGVANGKLYVIGGLKQSGSTLETLSTNQSFDPSTGNWNNEPGLPSPRMEHAIAEVNNKLYVFGGNYSAFGSSIDASVLEFDPSTGNWASISTMPTPRYQLTAVTLDNKIYVLGGFDVSGPTGTVEVFDPSTKQWQTKTSIPIPRTQFGAAVYGGKIYVFGGWTTGNTRVTSVQVYDPSTDQWENKEPMPEDQANLSAYVIGKKIYIVGGWWTPRIWEYTP